MNGRTSSGRRGKGGEGGTGRLESNGEPRFCPYAECAAHHQDREPVAEPQEGKGRRGRKGKGWYTKRGGGAELQDGRRYQRYRCKICGRSFSTRQFSLSYAQHREMDLLYLRELLVSGVSIRGIGRLMGCSPGTVLQKQRLLMRLSLQVLLELKEGYELEEGLVVDGFESYAVSKYGPHDVHLVVTKESQLVMYFNVASFKRKGKLSEEQQKRCEELYAGSHFERGAVTKQFTEVLEVMLDLRDAGASVGKERRLDLYTDEKPQYGRVVGRSKRVQELQERGQFSHRQIPGAAYRSLRNPLFAVNYMDRELRKDLAEFRRKSACFARDLGAQMQRVAVYLCWHNLYKPYRINGDGRWVSHAEQAGCDSEVITRCLGQMGRLERPFLSRLKGMPKSWEAIWKDEVSSPIKRLTGNRLHGRYQAAYALA